MLKRVDEGQRHLHAQIGHLCLMSLLQHDQFRRFLVRATPHPARCLSVFWTGPLTLSIARTTPSFISRAAVSAYSKRADARRGDLLQLGETYF